MATWKRLAETNEDAAPPIKRPKSERLMGKALGVLSAIDFTTESAVEIAEDPELPTKLADMPRSGVKDQLLIMLTKGSIDVELMRVYTRNLFGNNALLGDIKRRLNEYERKLNTDSPGEYFVAMLACPKGAWYSLIICKEAKLIRFYDPLSGGNELTARVIAESLAAQLRDYRVVAAEPGLGPVATRSTSGLFVLFAAEVALGMTTGGIIWRAEIPRMKYRYLCAAMQ